MKREIRWTIFKDYYRNGEPMQDHWCILYGTQEEAIAAKKQLEGNSDPSWFDRDDSDESAFLYVDQIEV